MTNEQLYLAMGLPMAYGAVLLGILVAYINSKFEAMNSKFEAKFDAVNARFDAIDARFTAVDQRLDDLRDLWRSELHRVEEVLDARLRHLEER